VRKVLLDLQRERMVEEELVVQRRGKQRVRGELDIDALRKQIERADAGAFAARRGRLVAVSLPCCQGCAVAVCLACWQGCPVADSLRGCAFRRGRCWIA
jgi:hypothetical protein